MPEQQDDSYSPRVTIDGYQKRYSGDLRYRFLPTGIYINKQNGLNYLKPNIDKPDYKGEPEHLWKGPRGFKGRQQEFDDILSEALDPKKTKIRSFKIKLPKS